MRRRSELVVAPEGGLCNRLRVVLSLLAALPEVGKPVRVAWADNAECAAPFAALFEPLDRAGFEILPRTWTETPNARGNLHLPGLLRSFRYGFQCANYRYQEHGALPLVAAHARRVYLSTCYPTTDYPASLARQLCPLPHLRERIGRLLAPLGEDVIGVHIRRTDNAESIRHSSLDDFREAMNAHPSAAFYVATDDASVRATLEREYSGRIFGQTAPVSRHTLAGMEAAVIDLFCLSRTRLLIGSYWSSFTDMAAEIGGQPLHIATRHPIDY